MPAFGNLLVKAILNSPLHPLLGERFAVITYRGRKSGKLYSTPINVADLEGVLTATSARGRTWWRNLRGGQTVGLRHRGSSRTMRAEVVETAQEVAAGLAAYFRRVPGDARFFHVRLAPDGQPEAEDLKRAAEERVLIRFHSE